MKDEYTKRTAENWKQFEGMEILVSDSLKGGWVMFKLIIYNRHEIYPFVTTGGNYKYARIKNVKEVEKVCELCDTPITEDTNDCCMGRELEELERQLAEAREVIKRVEDLATDYYCQKSEYEESVEIPYWDIIFALNIKEKV